MASAAPGQAELQRGRPAGQPGSVAAAQGHGCEATEVGDTGARGGGARGDDAGASRHRACAGGSAGKPGHVGSQARGTPAGAYHQERNGVEEMEE